MAEHRIKRGEKGHVSRHSSDIITGGTTFPEFGGLDAEDTPVHLSRSMNAARLAGEINPLAVELEPLLNRVPGDRPAVIVHASRTASKGRQANLVVSINHCVPLPRRSQPQLRVRAEPNELQNLPVNVMRGNRIVSHHSVSDETLLATANPMRLDRSA
ncbi:hypothetical protein [Thiocystis minor]|uniref:hypothetical protein n=1 Tax=Thiocystis minor TaxID=61597 RepID=UPI001914928D|nr:hypothetical protein [Thiocystis minor]